MAGDFLKDLYYGLEGKYYAILDRIDKAIPIYKIVDPIDRIVPSFAIVLIVIILLLLFGGWFLFTSFIAKPTVGITIQVESRSGDLISGASVKLVDLGKTFTTNSKGIVEKQEFEKNAVIKYEVSKTGFVKKISSFTADKSKVQSIILTEEAAGSFTRTIILKNSIGMPITKTAKLSFSCTGSGEPEPKETTTNNGSVTVKVPNTCGVLTANVEVQGYQAKQSVQITQNVQEIRLEELASELATVRARVLYNSAPVPGIVVRIFEHSLGPIDEKTTDSAGIAEFRMPQSTYNLRTVATAEYGSKATEEFETAPGQTIEKTLNVEKDVSIALTVNVVEKTTGKKIQNASVSVRQDNELIDSKSTDSNGTAFFNLNSLGEYTISADHSNYLIGEETFNITQQGSVSKTLVLEKFTGDNAATLKVKVLDAETGKGVKAARVALYYGEGEEKEGFLAPYAEQLTDLNGIARFPRVKPGVYYKAFAVKQGASGSSDSQRFDLRNADTFYLNVSMVIPHGTVKVNVSDNEGLAVPNAKITIFDAFDDSEIGSDLADFNGVFVLPAENRFAKADKEVYVRVEKKALSPGEKDYASYTTIAKPILPNAVQTFNVVLIPEIISGEFKLEFLGLFKKDKQVSGINPAGKAVPNVSPGQSYTGKFRILVPEGKTYFDAIVHLHSGKGELGYGIMEKDSIVLKEINMPLSNNILKATSLDKSNGYDNDVATATDGDAKWANIPLAVLSPGVYEIEALFEVKDTATVGEQIGIYSWMFADSEGGRAYFPRIETTPLDDLYFEPPQKQLYQVGVATLCDKEFCFNASIIEVVETGRGVGESVEESFNARILKNYKLVFSISNNSPTTVHNDAQLRVKNEDEGLLLKNYSITLPSGRSVNGSAGESELPNIEIQNSQNQNRFEQGAVISGDIFFTPQKSTNSILSFKVLSSSNPPGLFNVVFQKDLTIVVSAQNEFTVELSQQELAAGVENSVEVLVKDAKTGLEVEGANVTAKDRFGNPITTASTSRLGKAQLRLPALLPGEQLTIEVSKPDYNVKKVSIKANAKLLEISPETISIAANATIEIQKNASFSLKNVSAIPLKVESIEFKGNTKGLIDDATVNDALVEQQGFELMPSESQTLEFTAFLTQEALSIKERQQLEGTVIVRVGNYGSTWSFEIPVKITIGFGAELDSEDCLQVFPNSWTATTEGKSVSYSFKVQNNCSSNGSPIALSNLEARVEWQGNEIGTFTLALYHGELSGALSAAELRSGYFKKLLDRVDAEKSFDAKVSFTPFGGTNGTANAKIIIRAKNKSESDKDQIISSQVNAQIHVINLKECISFSKDIVVIEKDAKTQAGSSDFTISNKAECGQVKLFLSALPSDTIEISKTELTLADGATSEAIQVLASKGTYPGQYGIQVKAQAAGQATSQALTSLIEKDKILRVRVWDSGACLQLDKYEFDVFDNPQIPDDGFDSTELANYCYQKDASFKVDMQSFLNAAKDGLKWGALTTLIGLLGDSLNKKFGYTQPSLEEQVTSSTIALAKLQEAQTKVAATKTQTASALTATTQAKTQAEGLVKTTSTDAKTDKSKTPTNLPTDKKIGDTEYADLGTDAKKMINVCFNAASKWGTEEASTETVPSSDDVAREERILPDTSNGTVVTAKGKQPEGRSSEILLAEAATAGASASELSSKFGGGALTESKLAIDDAKACAIEMKSFLCEGGTIAPLFKAYCEAAKVKLLALIGVAQARNNYASTKVAVAQTASTSASTVETSANTSVIGSITSVSAITSSPNITPAAKTILKAATEQLTIASEQETGPGALTARNISTIETGAATKLGEINTEVTGKINTELETAQTSAATLETLPAVITALETASAETEKQIKETENMTKQGGVLSGLSQDNLDDAVNRSTSADSAVGTAKELVSRAKDALSSPEKFAAPAKEKEGTDWGPVLGTIGAMVMPGNPAFLGGLFGKSPISQGLGVFLGKTFYNMQNQETLEFTTTKTDLEVGSLQMYSPKGAPASEIGVGRVGSASTDNRIDSKLSDQAIEVRFTNNSPANEGTFFKLLKVNAERHYYKDKTYSIDEIKVKSKGGFLGSLFDQPSEGDIDADEVDLEEEEDSPSDASQYFMVQFNAISPEDIVQDTIPEINVDCASFMPPGIQGNTDVIAAPKMLFSWSWNSIESDTCDEENPNAMFCDGVQFSIALLKKIELVKEFLASNTLQCPSGTEAMGTKENVIGEDNIGISKIYSDVVARSGIADVNVVVEIENTTPGNVSTALTVTVVNSNTLAALPACTKTVNVVSKSVIGCEFSGLAQDNTTYTVVARIEPEIAGCAIENCNRLTQDDVIETAFAVSQRPLLQDCEPYNTSRLEAFINSTEKQGESLTYPQGLSKGEFLKNLKFNVYLIQDRFAPDLQSDFDDYYRNIAFAQTPAWYKGGDEGPGLGEIFKDFKVFRIGGTDFESVPSIGYLLSSPGLYEGSIEIEFDNAEWQFFTNGQADVKALVKLRKSGTQPLPISPFYYLAFDGAVGTLGTEAGRINYGLNYLGEPLQIVSGAEALRAVGHTGSPYSANAFLNTETVSSFKAVNVDRRGQILSVKRNNDGSFRLVLSPSFATPAILKISNNSGEACASYNFGINGVDTYTGMESNLWWGVGENCRDFYDAFVIEKFQNGVPDISNQTTGAWGTRCGSAQTPVYGLEWPDTQQNYGNVFLKTIFYTPQGGQNTVNIVMSSDDAEFWPVGSDGKVNIPLNGVGASATILESVAEIVELVKQRQVCVSGESVEQTFWWNPTPVINALADKETKAETECIK